MELRFYIDPETGYPHIYNHSVAEDEVFDVLSHPGLELIGRNNSKLTLGQTEAGRYLKVVSTQSKQTPGALFIVTAYELSGKELKAYKRRRRKKS